MRASRRGILKAAGGLTLLVAAGGVWRAIDASSFAHGSGPAYAPWDDWRIGMSEGPLALVRAGILAASPHNSQPWRFRVFPSRIELHADPVRTLGAADPYLREMHLGLGCALENMLLAAPQAGFAVDLEVAAGRLDGDAVPAGPVATLRLSRIPAVAGPFAEAIFRRRTNRGPYDLERPLSPEMLSSIGALPADMAGVRVVLFTDPEQRAAFGAEVQRAAEGVLTDEAMLVAEDAWWRTDGSAIQSLRDGMATDTLGVGTLGGVFGRLLPEAQPSARFRVMLARLREVQLPSSPAFGLLAVKDLYDLGQTIAAGRAWQRLHLWATREGLALQPLNRMLACVDRARRQGRASETAQRLAGFIGDPEWQPSFAFRAGYPLEETPPSPRRPVEWVLMPRDAAAYTPT